MAGIIGMSNTPTLQPQHVALLSLLLAAAAKEKPKPKPAPGGKKKPTPGVPLPGYPVRQGLDTPTQWGGGGKPRQASPARLLMSAGQTPMFSTEGPQLYDRAYAHNAPFAKPGPYATPLHPSQEASFLQWLAANRIPFDPGAARSDYDMTGYWLAHGNSPPTTRESNGQVGFTDTYKTPYDTTFSAESEYAKPGTPFVWHGSTLIDRRDGRVVFARR